MRNLLATALVLTFGACAPPAAPMDLPGNDVAPAADGPADNANPLVDDDGSSTADEPDPAPQDNSPTPAPLTLTPGCTATAKLAGYPTWFFFTRPDKPCTGTPSSGIDRHAVNELTRLIGSVPAGGRIDGHIFSITVDEVAKALLDAQTRGVDVRISTDGGVAASLDTAKTNYLDKLVSKVYCTSANNSACISTADSAISHTKLFVFSTATAPDGTVGNSVSWFGSANQTYASGMKLYNNTVTVYGDAGLFTKLRAYLDDLYGRARVRDYYDPASGRGHLLASAADIYVSPEVQTDLVVNRLDNLTPDADCRVRVMQASIRDSRMDVVDRLVQMKNSGCQVWVVADTVESGARAALRAAGIPMHQMPIHDKAFIIYGKYGAAYEHHVFSGSHNLSGGAAHDYDEIFVKLAPETPASHPVYDAYYTHFNDAYNSGPAL